MSKTQAQEGPGENGTSRLSRDDLFEILSNRRRRYVLHYLRTADGGLAELSDVVEQVAAWEQGVDREELSYDDRKSVHISLYQHHAPKLDEAGIVDYDKRGGVLELTAEAEELDVYLDPVPDSGVPWWLYFPALSAAAGVVVLSGWLDVVPLGVPDVAWAAVAVVAFGLSSAAFLYDTRYRTGAGPAGPPPEVAED
jgi:DNA-binding transcriptional ArsR family regulator